MDIEFDIFEYDISKMMEYFSKLSLDDGFEYMDWLKTQVI